MLTPDAPDAEDRPSKGGETPRREMRVVLAAPRGFCAGVRRAIDAVRDALAVHGAPVYVRRPIVHNMEVVRSLEVEGAIFVQELDEVPAGSVIIFSAHGVAPSVARESRERRLIAYDAVCPLVGKVHREVNRHQRNGRKVIVIGHHGHPEIEGTLGHADEAATFVVNSMAEVEALPIERSAPVAYAVQTTYSVDDAAEIVTALQARFADLAGPASSDICYATTNRQAAVREIASSVDALIVVGESFSSNARRLAEVGSGLCESVQLVAGPAEIDWDKLAHAHSTAVTAAASTPETSVQAVVAALGRRFCIHMEESGAGVESAIFKRLAIA